jgi:hypothetical protein
MCADVDDGVAGMDELVDDQQHLVSLQPLLEQAKTS